MRTMKKTVDTPHHTAEKWPTGRPLPFLIADAFYLLLVYGWFFRTRPTGLSFQQLATSESMDTLPRVFFHLLVDHFGNWSPGYILVNLFLLYASMVLVLILTRLLTREPWWLGSVAAVLFISFPAKTAAIFSLGGIQWLLPAFLGLLFLVIYAFYRRSSKSDLAFLPLLTYIVLCLVTPSNISLFAVVAMMEYTCFRDKSASSSKQPFVIAGVGVTFLFVSGQVFFPEALSFKGMFAPLLLFINPIGFLPQSLSFFSHYPFFGYGLGILLFVGVCLLLRRCNEGAVRFGFLGIFACRLGQGHGSIDLTTMENGGTLLIPAALLSVAVGAAFLHLATLPTWRPAVLRISTLLCFAALICQGWVNLQWHRGGQNVELFRQQAYALAEESPRETLALFPDIRYVGFVPWMLSDSIEHQSCLGDALPFLSLADVSLIPPWEIEVDLYTGEEGRLLISGLHQARPFHFHPFRREWWHQRITPLPPVSLEVWGTPKALPVRRIPFP